MKKTLIVSMMVLLAAILIVSCNNNANSPVMHKVTFNSDNGSNAEVKEVKDGETVAEPSKPTRKGYAFAGWYEGETKFEFSTKITKDYSLKAKWILLPSVGDTKEYGTYPDNYAVSNLQNQPTTWKVLSVDEANLRILVISEKVLDKQIWNNTAISSYEHASVRTYLNNDIYNNYSLSSYTNILNVDFDDDTITIGSGSDHLFLLSESEVSTYFGTNSKVASGAANTWWLRTCTYNGTMGAYQTRYINENGNGADHGSNGSLGLRPAMWVSLSN